MEPRIRVAAIIVRDEEILLVAHEKEKKSYWLLPGGGVNVGESLEAALCRELLEETGLEIEIGDLVMANDSIAPDGSRHIVNLYFLADVVSGEIQVGGDERVVECRYVSLMEFSGLDFRPDLRDEISAGIKKGFSSLRTYQGARWK